MNTKVISFTFLSYSRWSFPFFGQAVSLSTSLGFLFLLVLCHSGHGSNPTVPEEVTAITNPKVKEKQKMPKIPETKSGSSFIFFIISTA